MHESLARLKNTMQAVLFYQEQGEREKALDHTRQACLELRKLSLGAVDLESVRLENWLRMRAASRLNC